MMRSCCAPQEVRYHCAGHRVSALDGLRIASSGINMSDLDCGVVTSLAELGSLGQPSAGATSP
eukprot:556038-Alexandrium_andersonii.AAC.1